jgi:hypothetical protein
MNVVQVRQPLQHSQCDLTHNVDVDGSNLLVNPVQRTLIHKLHADADIGVRDECAVKRDDVWRIAVMHDLQFSQNLFPH